MMPRLLYAYAFFMVFIGLAVAPTAMASESGAGGLVAEFLAALRDNDEERAKSYFINPKQVDIITPDVKVYEGNVNGIVHGEIATHGELWRAITSPPGRRDAGFLMSLNADINLEFIYEDRRWQCQIGSVGYELKMETIDETGSFDLNLCTDAEDNSRQWRILGTHLNVASLYNAFSKEVKFKYMRIRLERQLKNK